MRRRSRLPVCMRCAGGDDRRHRVRGEQRAAQGEELRPLHQRVHAAGRLDQPRERAPAPRPRGALPAGARLYSPCFLACKLHYHFSSLHACMHACIRVCACMLRIRPGMHAAHHVLACMRHCMSLHACHTAVPACMWHCVLACLLHFKASACMLHIRPCMHAALVSLHACCVCVLACMLCHHGWQWQLTWPTAGAEHAVLPHAAHLALQ
jgi:hypothetical protein